MWEWPDRQTDCDPTREAQGKADCSTISEKVRRILTVIPFEKVSGVAPSDVEQLKEGIEKEDIVS